MKRRKFTVDHWFAKWFFKTYLIAIATHGGAIWVFLQFLGYYDEATTFLKSHRALAVLGLTVHFILTLIEEMCSNSKRELAEMRKRDLGNDGTND